MSVSDVQALLLASCLTNMEKSKVTMQLIAGWSATVATMCAGFHIGWASPSLHKLLAADSDIPITSDQSSWLVSIFIIGSGFGSFIVAPLVDGCGRKLSLLFGAIPHLSSCILIGVTKNYWCLMVARLIAGIGMGMTYVAIPIYLGEIADDRIRGALGSMVSVMVNGGILLTYCVGPWVSRVALAGLGAALPLLFGLMFIWMPESPYFLIMKQKPVRAEKSLLWLTGKKNVSDEVKKVQANIEFDKKNAGSIKELVTMPGNRKALTIVLGLIAAQQFSGISAILAYSSLIFEASGSTLDASISVIIIGVVQLLSGVLTIFTVDLAGRRPLLLFSAVSSILFLGGEALYFQLQAMGNDVSVISWLPVTAMIGYMIFYTIGLGSLPLVILSEIFPYNIKASATMFVVIVNSASGTAVSQFYQIVSDEYGIHVSFWGFGLFTTFSLIFIYFMLPETKQRPLRTIQEELHKTTESTVALDESDAA